METKEILKFLDRQTSAIKGLYKNQNLSYWNATISGKKEDYNKYEKYQKEIAKFFNDSINFNKVKEILDLNHEDILIKRQIEVLYNSYLSNQGNLKLINN